MSDIKLSVVFGNKASPNIANIRDILTAIIIIPIALGSLSNRWLINSKIVAKTINIENE